MRARFERAQPSISVSIIEPLAWGNTRGGGTETPSTPRSKPRDHAGTAGGSKIAGQARI